MKTPQNHPELELSFQPKTVPMDKILGITVQGGRVKYKTPASAIYSETFSPGGGRRGTISTFSNGSAKRLSELMATLDFRHHIWLFITLTYPQSIAPSGADSKRHIKMLSARLIRKWPTCSFIWRLEKQSNGSPHFHLVMSGVNPSYPGKCDASFALEGDFISASWSKVIEYRYSTIFELVVLKSPVGATIYLTSGHSTKRNQVFHGEDAGRYWGIINKSHLPKAVFREGVPTPQFVRILRKLWYSHEKRRVSFFLIKKKKKIKIRPWQGVGTVKLFRTDLSQIVDRLQLMGIDCFLEKKIENNEKIHFLMLSGISASFCTTKKRGRGVCSLMIPNALNTGVFKRAKTLFGEL